MSKQKIRSMVIVAIVAAVVLIAYFLGDAIAANAREHLSRIGF